MSQDSGSSFNELPNNGSPNNGSPNNRQPKQAVVNGNSSNGNSSNDNTLRRPLGLRVAFDNNTMNNGLSDNRLPGLPVGNNELRHPLGTKLGLTFGNNLEPYKHNSTNYNMLPNIRQLGKAAAPAAAAAAGAPSSDSYRNKARTTNVGRNNNFNTYDEFIEFMQDKIRETQFLKDFKNLFSKKSKANHHIVVGTHPLENDRYLKLYLFIHSNKPTIDTNELSLEKFYREVYLQQMAVANIRNDHTPLQGLPRKPEFKVPSIYHYGEINVNDDSDVRTFYSSIDPVATKDKLCMAYIIMDRAAGTCIRPDKEDRTTSRNDLIKVYKDFERKSFVIDTNITTGTMDQEGCLALNKKTLHTILFYIHSLLQNGNPPIFHNDLGHGNNIFFDVNSLTFTIIDFGEATEEDNSERSFAGLVKFGYGGSRHKRHTRKQRTRKQRTRKQHARKRITPKRKQRGRH